METLGIGLFLLVIMLILLSGGVWIAMINVIAKAAIPFIGCLVLCIALVTLFPQIVTYLPNAVMGIEK